MRALELWASPEPTMARLDTWRVRDQRAETGHLQRESDIERLAALGISATRYPVLWESVAPDDPQVRDYTWETRRLTLLERRGIEPIVTLLHHGSGPSYTSLTDERFPELFADYAEATARRFPWVRRWTPINEPLTTARFSTLYGVWYPNQRSDAAFGAAIVNEMHGFLLAMQRIRKIVPDAEFMLTDDLQNFIAADRGAHDYAAHKRERGFLSADLLCGRVDAGHALYSYLVDRCAIPPERLASLRCLARPPDVLGWNYYPNSERHLRTAADGTIDNVPLLDAIGPRLSPRPMLRAAWQRYGIPLALSEVHVFGDEVERVRWLVHRHDDVVALRAEGIEIRALGAWAAFGMVDWSSLLRSRRNCREDGVYTCAGPQGEPQPTGVARALQTLARGGRPELQTQPGWWERERPA